MKYFNGGGFFRHTNGGSTLQDVFFALRLIAAAFLFLGVLYLIAK